MSADRDLEESAIWKERQENRSLQLQVARLEQRLQDMVELVHMWRDEATAYRGLAEAVVNGEYPLAKAKQTLNRSSVQKRLPEEAIAE